MTKKVFLKFNHPYSAFQLDCWLDLFDSPACKVTRAEDGKCCLTACRLEKLTDLGEWRESAKNLITMMTAFAKIEGDKDFQPNESDDKEVSIDSIIEQTENKHTVYVDAKPIILCSTVVLPKFEVLDKDGRPMPQERQERWYDYYLNRCDDLIDSTVMFKALVNFAKKTTSLTLRLTYETIKDDEGGKYQLLRNNGWVTEPELNSFTGSIHHAEGQELQAEYQNPNSTYVPEMSLSEAQTFLAQRLLKKWLIKKRDRYKLAEGAAQAKSLANILGF